VRGTKRRVKFNVYTSVLSGVRKCIVHTVVIYKCIKNIINNEYKISCRIFFKIEIKYEKKKYIKNILLLKIFAMVLITQTNACAIDPYLTKADFILNMG